MKFLILLADGMADYPLDVLDGKTPLEYAHTPNMDTMAQKGTMGLIDTIPRGLQAGSDVANLAVLGYDPRRCYTGRGPLEAANLGITLSPDDIAFRCNLITLSDETGAVMEDFTAGHISSEESRQLLSDFQSVIGSAVFQFWPGVGYRNLMVWKGGNDDLSATPPHDITGKSIAEYLPRGSGSDEINRLMTQSLEFFADHPINVSRRRRGLRPATSIWLWGQGKAPRIEKITDRFNIRGGVISAVDLLNGIGVYAGLEVLPVAGATGYTDTNYQGKAEKALTALRHLDLVFVHVEAPDEMGHEGNITGKIKAIEDFDEKVVGTVLRSIDSLGSFRVAVLCDHPTPITLRTHAADPSPFAVISSITAENQSKGYSFGEGMAVEANNVISPGHLFMELFIGQWGNLLGKVLR